MVSFRRALRSLCKRGQVVDMSRRSRSGHKAWALPRQAEEYRAEEAEMLRQM